MESVLSKQKTKIIWWNLAAIAIEAKTVGDFFLQLWNFMKHHRKIFHDVNMCFKCKDFKKNGQFPRQQKRLNSFEIFTILRLTLWNFIESISEFKMFKKFFTMETKEKKGNYTDFFAANHHVTRLEKFLGMAWVILFSLSCILFQLFLKARI